MPDYDLTVIGSGPGRYVAAIHAARLGARVAILEQKDTEWGGTCLNWSCIPTKALIHGAEVFQTVRRVPEFGVRVPEPEIDWPAMQGRKDRVVEAMRKGVQKPDEGQRRRDDHSARPAGRRDQGQRRWPRTQLGLRPAGSRLDCRAASRAGRRAGPDKQHHPGARPRARVNGRDRRWSADYTAMPACIYTDPEIAYVGLSEAQARAKGEDVEVGQFPFSALGRATILGDTSGLVKVVADKDGYLLGVTIMRPRATDLIAEAALALNVGMTAAELSRVVHAHPTLPEAIAEAALDVDGRAVHVAPTKRPQPATTPAG